ncbi:hypothetical protein JIY74_25340 [Vibrio harveyi]|nr:hypothetical protein [Vibrio harveyi]
MAEVFKNAKKFNQDISK